MKKHFRVLVLLLLLATVLQSQTPFQSYFTYSGPSSNSITEVNAVMQNLNLDWEVVGNANEPLYFPSDVFPVIFTIDHNYPGTVIHFPKVIKPALNLNAPIAYIPKDIVLYQGTDYAICGLIKSDALPGGSVGFLLIVDADHNPMSLFVYNNMLTINSLIFAEAYDKLILVGRSYQDPMGGGGWTSQPGILVVEGGSPNIITDSYVCTDAYPQYNEGEFNDVEAVSPDYFVMVGKYNMVEQYTPSVLSSYDLLISAIRLDPGGTILSNEDVVVRACEDLSNDIGEAVVVASPTEMYICGESWDPSSQANPQKSIMAMQVLGSIVPGNLTGLTYNYKEYYFGYQNNNSYAYDVDYQIPTSTLSITGNYATSAGVSLPYVLQIFGFGVSLASDFNWGTGYPYDLQRTFILNTNPSILCFGTVEYPLGNSSVLAIGDDLNIGPQICKSIIPVVDFDCLISVFSIGYHPHDDQVTTVTQFDENPVQLTVQAVCNIPVFNSPIGNEKVTQENTSARSDVHVIMDNKT